MFQVSSRPAQPTFDMQHHPIILPSVQLPRTLSRPAYAEVSPDVLAAIDPGLAQVPPEFARRSLHGRGDEMLASISALQIPRSVPKSRLPSSFEVALPYTASPPTHILAVFTSPSSKGPASDAALLIPTHHVALAANCAHLPRMPTSRPQARANGAATLPVIPITVPTAEAFAPLNAFLISHRLDRFIGALLPVPPAMLAGARASGSSQGNPLAHVSAPQLATYLASTAKGDRMSALMSLTRTVSAVWRNACALGVFDRDLWAGLDLAWEVILGAMNMVASGQV